MNYCSLWNIVNGRSRPSICLNVGDFDVSMKNFVLLKILFNNLYHYFKLIRFWKSADFNMNLYLSQLNRVFLFLRFFYFSIHYWAFFATFLFFLCRYLSGFFLIFSEHFLILGGFFLILGGNCLIFGWNCLILGGNFRLLGEYFLLCV